MSLPSSDHGFDPRRPLRGRSERVDWSRSRGVAQSGSAPGWGPGGRRFKSCLPDHDLPGKRDKRIVGAQRRGAFWGANFAPHLHPSASQLALRRGWSTCDRKVSSRVVAGRRRPSVSYAARAPGPSAERVARPAPTQCRGLLRDRRVESLPAATATRSPAQGRTKSLQIPQFGRRRPDPAGVQTGITWSSIAGFRAHY